MSNRKGFKGFDAENKPKRKHESIAAKSQIGKHAKTNNRIHRIGDRLFVWGHITRSHVPKDGVAQFGPLGDRSTNGQQA